MKSENQVLIYDNYPNKKSTIPNKLHKLCLDTLDVLKDFEIGVDIEFPNQMKIEDKENELFSFFCYQDIINGTLQLKLDPDSILTKDSGYVKFEHETRAIISEVKENISEIRLVAYMELESEITSILFLVDRSTSFNIIQDLYLMNYDRNRILSIVRMAYVYRDENALGGNTLIDEKEGFIFRDFVIEKSTQKILENSKKSSRGVKKVEYRVNSQGKIDITK